MGKYIITAIARTMKDCTVYFPFLQMYDDWRNYFAPIGLIFCDMSILNVLQKKNKKLEVSFSCICPIIENEFCHNIIKVAEDP